MSGISEKPSGIVVSLAVGPQVQAVRQPHITSAETSHQGRINRRWTINRTPGRDSQAAKLDGLEQQVSDGVMVNAPSPSTYNGGND